MGDQTNTTTIDRPTGTEHRIGTREEWLAAREALLEREKEHTRLGDELARERRQLPWVRVEEPYTFDTDQGKRTLAELFDGRSQLLLYHFMFGPSYDAGDPVNSSIADAMEAVLPHVHARDATLVLVSQAPIEKLSAYKQRMGWSVPWVSAGDSGFNIDYGFSRAEDQTREAMAPILEGGTGDATGSPIEGVKAGPLQRSQSQLPLIVEPNVRSAGTDLVAYLSESPGFTAFVLEDGVVYHTYSTTWRGVEFLMTYYPILDRAPKGRDEGDAWQVWLRRHDEYDE